VPSKVCSKDGCDATCMKKDNMLSLNLTLNISLTMAKWMLLPTASSEQGCTLFNEIVTNYEGHGGIGNNTPGLCHHLRSLLSNVFAKEISMPTSSSIMGLLEPSTGLKYTRY
jgi:hypothetical protein